MARIPQEEIERIKREVKLTELAARRGIELVRHGEDNLMGRCPWHEDATPSLCVSPAKNLWHCLGACNVGGDVIEWVMKMENVGFRHAVEMLLGGVDRLTREGKTRIDLPPIELGEDERECLERVAAYYEERLHAATSPQGLEYLEHRGIRNEDFLRSFRIGFADRTLGLRIPESAYKKGRETREALQRAGLFRENGREHFRGCITFPIVDGNGEIVQIYGRKIRDDNRHKHGFHLYLPRPQRGVWNLDGIRESGGTVILCEALIDAATFWCAGYRNVTSAYGVNGFTSEMLEAFKANHVERVLIAYDRDEAGDKAAEHLGLSLAREGMGAFRVVFPRFMDANDYARKVTPSTQSLGLLLHAAEWMGGPKHRGVLGPLPTVLLEREGQVTPATPAMTPHQEPLQPLVVDHHAEVAPAAIEEDPDALLPLAARPVVTPAVVGAINPLPSPPSPPVEPDRSLAVSDYSTIDLSFGDRRYRVRGLEKNLNYNQMKVVLRVARGELVFLDTLDLVAARHRAAYVKQAAVDMGLTEEVIKHDIASVYRQLEQIQEQMIKKTLEPKSAKPSMSEEDMHAAMELCRDPRIFDRLLGDYERCGVVGERVNKLVAFLGAISRLLDDPIAILIQSSSAAGKTKLMDAVLDLTPEEERERYSAMTGQSLFYFEGKSLQHKILAVSEEEGAERAAYALKLLQSEGQLTIASTGKNPTTGRLETQEYRVEGPVMIFLTTTAVEIDEELRNRCIVLTVDEDREQTRAIHELQRAGETLEGMIAREERRSILKLWRNAQRLLRPLRIINPYARLLRFPDGSTRMRRDHPKYLALIRSIALLHQHQRERKIHPHPSGPIEYIEVTKDDIALANELAHEVLGHSIDELSPQTRRLLAVLDENVGRECSKRGLQRCDYRFTNREARDWSGWSDFQVRTHIHKLLDMEYMLLHRGGRGQSFVYELLYDGKGRDGKPFLMGLIEPAELDLRQDPEHRRTNPEHPKGENEHATSIQRAPFEQGSSPEQNGGKPSVEAVLLKKETNNSKKTHRGGNGKASSYPQPVVAQPRGEA